MANVPVGKDVLRDPGTSGLSSRERAHLKVKAFLRRLKFANYIKMGMSPEEAARRVGIKIPFGETLEKEEITKLLETGLSSKKF